MTEQEKSNLSSTQARGRGFLCGCRSDSFAFTPLFIKILNTRFGVPALVITMWRNILGIALLFPAFLIFKPSLLKLERKHFGFIALYGVVFTLLKHHLDLFNPIQQCFRCHGADLFFRAPDQFAGVVAA